MNMFFSRWMGPLVGVLVGLIAGAVMGMEDHSLGFWAPLMVGGGLGLSGGVLMLLADPAVVEDTEEVSSDPRAKPTLSGNVLCLLSLIFFFMPFFSIALSGLALAFNWKVKGWARWCSWIGLLIGLGVSSLFVWLWTTRTNIGG